MSCDLPDRQERAYPEPGNNWMYICLGVMWGNYNGDRVGCLGNQYPTCQDKLDCEQQAWDDYNLFFEGCIDQYEDSTMLLAVAQNQWTNGLETPWGTALCMSGGKLAGGGIGFVLIALVVSYFLGIDPQPLLEAGS
ncbi:MAG: hypothetical protein MJH10_21150, partial [Epibacterium sp.]|nr:hypothetical protein [Epibacterium sp.]NQX75963.1 hypothetical protein [Epibacterium sp.]